MSEVEIRGTCPERYAAVRAAFADNFARGEELGARFALVEAGQLVVDLWAGHADRARTRPFDDRTLTPVFSTTKAIAAILTIVGYSLNETVVVFDRTRELLRRYKTMPIPELLDLSVNSTLSRTATTATTTFLSLLALVIFGGSAIEGFALVMLFGVVVCTYSAMFISTPVLLYMDVRGQGHREEAREKALAGAKPKAG